MALTDSENPSNTQRTGALPPLSGRRPIPHEYLARLAVLHVEAAQDLRTGALVGRSAGAAGLVMLAGALTLLSGGGTLASDFVWSLLVLGGVLAMTANYIRGQARAPARRIRLEDAAADLRAMLLYTGFAWGAGAFLALPGDTGVALAIAFAIAPSALLAALLRDEAGVAAFTAPAAALTAIACLLRHWPGGAIAACVILTAGIAVVAALRLRDGCPAVRQSGAA